MSTNARSTSVRLSTKHSNVGGFFRNVSTDPRRRLRRTILGIFCVSITIASLLGVIDWSRKALLAPQAQQQRHEITPTRDVPKDRFALAVQKLSVPALPSLDPACHARLHADVGGVPAGRPGGGADTEPPTPAEGPAECCARCKAHEGSPRCDVWSFNEQNKQCKLLSQRENSYPERPLLWHGADSPWTSGVLYDRAPTFTGASPCVHTVITANGIAYTNWQTRLMFASWKRAAAAGGAGNVMTKFTRILHRTADDELMAEIPTVRVQPRRPECDVSCDFVIADRAKAVLDWMQTEDSQQCSHVLMAESDYFFVKPLNVFHLPQKGFSVGFHFGYVSPEYGNFSVISRRYVDETTPLARVPQTGNAPQLMHRDDMDKVIPLWAKMVDRIETDADAKAAWGWVRDMYAYSFAALKSGVQHMTELVPFNTLMVQPPADVTLGDAIILHWTWGPRISINGSVVWELDKRGYDGVSMPYVPPMPHWDPLMRLQAGEVVEKSRYELMRLLAETWNSLIDDL